MRTKLIALALATTACAIAAPAAPAWGQTRADQARWDEAQRRFDNERALYERERDRYEASRRRGGYGYRDRGRGDGGGRYGWRDGDDWEPSRYYREDPRYEERRLTAQDEVYRGSDGRYYCRRSDGTTGLIIGGAVGALIGNSIDNGRSSILGTLIGAGAGAALGREIERGSVRCR